MLANKLNNQNILCYVVKIELEGNVHNIQKNMNFIHYQIAKLLSIYMMIEEYFVYIFCQFLHIAEGHLISLNNNATTSLIYSMLHFNARSYNITTGIIIHDKSQISIAKYTSYVLRFSDIEKLLSFIE